MCVCVCVCACACACVCVCVPLDAFFVDVLLYDALFVFSLMCLPNGTLGWSLVCERGIPCHTI